MCVNVASCAPALLLLEGSALSLNATHTAGIIAWRCGSSALGGCGRCRVGIAGMGVRTWTGLGVGAAGGAGFGFGAPVSAIAWKLWKHGFGLRRRGRWLLCGWTWPLGDHGPGGGLWGVSICRVRLTGTPAWRSRVGRRMDGAGGGKTLRGVVGYTIGPVDLVLVAIASGGRTVARDMVVAGAAWMVVGVGEVAAGCSPVRCLSGGVAPRV